MQRSCAGEGPELVDFVVAYRPEWRSDFLREAAALRAALVSLEITFHHIGSTSIEGMRAKPIIDLLGEAEDLTAVDASSDIFVALGYEAMGEYGIAGRRYFRKMDGNGVRTHHLHVFATGSPHVERHLAFREYLRAHSETAAAYSDLKARLTARDDASWDSYVEGKAPFIQDVEPKAIAWFKSRQLDTGTFLLGPPEETKPDQVTHRIFDDPEVERVFAEFPSEAQRGLLELRERIFDVAARTDGVGRLEETLKWGQPAYLTTETRSGSTLRLGVPKEGGYAIYVHCQTRIVADVQTVFPDEFVYEGNRAIHFASVDHVRLEALEFFIRRVLTYHQK